MREDSLRTKGDDVHSRCPDRRPSEAVVAAVSAVTGLSPLEVDILNEAVDPDALNALVGTRDENDAPLTVAFEYSGYHVTVSSDRVQVDPIHG